MESNMNGGMAVSSVPNPVQARSSLINPQGTQQQLSPEVAQQLHELEVLAQQMYTGPTHEEMTHARARLHMFDVSAECIPQCQLILDNSSSNWAHILASQSLLKLVILYWNNFSPSETLDVRNYLLNYLGVNLGSLSKFVVSNLVMLVARIAKLGWNKEIKHREICKDVTRFLNLSAQHCILGLRILNELVEAMNSCITEAETHTQHRKVAVHFRDNSLLFILRLALTNLQQINSNLIQVTNADDDTTMKRLSISLLLRCLKFDYIGTNPEEINVDFGTIQVPQSWRGVFEDPTTVQLLFGTLTSVGQPEIRGLMMETIVEFAAVRRSLFSSKDARNAFLNNIVVATTDILQKHQQNKAQSILGHDQTFHHFCRLLDRIKSNYTLRELVGLVPYQSWIQEVAALTVESFNNWEWASNSIHYLLGLWARLTQAIPFMREKGVAPTFLDDFIPQVTQALMAARLDAIQEAAQNNEIEVLFQEPDLGGQLKHLPTLCRYKYAMSVQYIKQCLVPLVQQYKDAIQTLAGGNVGPQAALQLRVIEGRLALLFYYIGALIGGRPSAYASSLNPNSRKNEDDEIDADLCTCFFQIMPLLEARLAQQLPVAPLMQLDLAALVFLEHFRRAFIGQETSSMARGDTQSIYSRMSAALGQTSQDAIVAGVLKKIVTNLKFWVNTEEVLRQSLQLFHNLVVGYASSKVLHHMDTPKLLLETHKFELLPFMSVPGNEKFRVDFYNTMARLLYNTRDEHDELFDAFMNSFEQVFQAIAHELGNGRSDQMRRTAIGICCDMKGFLQGTRKAQDYLRFFEWAHPDILKVMARLLETWWDDPEISTPILEFMSEFVASTGQRMHFEKTSPNGVYIMQEASKFIRTYGAVLEKKDVPEAVVKAKIKSVGLCMRILSQTMSGGYVPFGVFKVYNERCFSTAYDTVVKLLLSINLNELLAFPDVSASYFVFLHKLFIDHSEMVVASDTKVVLALLSSLVDNLSHHDMKVTTQCSSAIDSFFSFRLVMGKKRGAEAASIGQRFDEHMKQSGDLCDIMLATLMNKYVFDRNQQNAWQFGRSIFPLIIYNKQSFVAYQQQFVNSQSPDIQQRLIGSFQKLMDGVLLKLSNSQRDNFSSSLQSFALDVSNYCVRPSNLL